MSKSKYNTKKQPNTGGNDLSKYEFAYKNMEFSKDGQLDELIALDRYAVPTYEGYTVGDAVVAIINPKTSEKKVAIIKEINGEMYTVIDRFGVEHTVEKELMHKPLETKPHQLWERWAKGASSVENEIVKDEVENNFRWLFDGYRYSPGGRIQLMLGQENITGQKAQLTSYNCFVIKSTRGKNAAVDQFLEVLDVAYKEASIMRRGGGTGTNNSLIKTVSGSGRTKEFFNFYLHENHKDYEELHDRVKLGKFDNVTVTNRLEYNKSTNIITVGDSVEGHFEAIKEMVVSAFGDVYDKVTLDFSNVRERNAIVKGVNGRSSGAVSWMELFVLVANLLQQDKVDNVDFSEIFSFIVHLIIQGGSRRGALMLICNDDNENIEKFINRKKQAGLLTGANLSVGISDKFMKKVKDKDEKALKLWNMIIESAWKSAEPGVVFLERYNNVSNSWYFNEIVATNPCGII